MSRTIQMKLIWILVCCVLSVGVLWPDSAKAGFTETLPEGTFMLEEVFYYSWLNDTWKNDGELGPLINDIERFEPGGGQQGVLSAAADVKFMMLVTKLQYGITDSFSLGIGIPVVLETSIDPNLKWEPGDYQPQLGRPYSEEDFWLWAESFGETKPTKWVGNKGDLSDIVLGLRWRFTDFFHWCKENGFHSALAISGVIPTGKNADPERLVTAGTSMWDLASQGDLTFHLGFDKTFEKELDGRLTIGIEGFYEVFFKRELTAATGTIHPLMLHNAPYVGDTYHVKPGDYSGVSLQIDGVLVKGPALGTWITGGDASKAEKLPPLLTASIQYSFMHQQQTDYDSNSPLWDWDKEEDWRPGYRNPLTFTLLFSFLRVGAPFQLYGTYRTNRLLPGKNCRASQIVNAGIRIPIPINFW